MGNHEYCELCGENDFHRGRPCDPEKVRQRQLEQEQRQANLAASVVRMRAALDAGGIKYTLSNYGYAEVSPHDY